MKNLLFIRVDYEDFKPETYKGVYVDTKDKQRLIHVNTGDFVFDYNFIMDFLKTYLKNNPTLDVFCSSSVDNYISDKGNIIEI